MVNNLRKRCGSSRTCHQVRSWNEGLADATDSPCVRNHGSLRGGGNEIGASSGSWILQGSVLPKLIAHVFVSWVPEGLAHQVSVSVLAKLGVWELGSGPYVQCRRRAAQRLESVRRAPRGGNCHACWFLGAFVWGCGQGFAPPGVLNFGRAVGGPRLDRRVARSWLHFVCGSAVHTHKHTQTQTQTQTHTHTHHT